MSRLTWITEKEREIKKQRRRILLERQRENFVSASREKMRNASGWQGEASKVKMSGSEKKKKRTGTQATKSLVST